MMADVSWGGMRSGYVLGMSLVHELLDVCIDTMQHQWVECVHPLLSPSWATDSHNKRKSMPPIPEISGCLT